MFLFPVYLYFAVGWHDSLVKYSRMFLLRIGYFVLYPNRGRQKLKEFINTKYKLEKKIVNMIEYYKETELKTETEERIVQRRESQFNFEKKMDNINKLMHM